MSPRSRAALALASGLLFVGCASESEPVTTLPPTSFNTAIEAAVNPEKMRVEPSVMIAGGSVEVVFADGVGRTPGFEVDRLDAGTWMLAWAANSDPESAQSRIWSARQFKDLGIEWEAGPGFDEAGAHRIPVPNDTAPGTYRVCRAVGDRLCAPFDVGRVADLPIDPAGLEQAISVWADQLGLAQSDESVWIGRLTTSCERGVWVEEVALELGGRWSAADSDLSTRGSGAEEPSVEAAAEAVWLMAVSVCSDRFPPKQVEEGPWVTTVTTSQPDDPQPDGGSNTHLLEVLEYAEDLPGIVPGGYDPSHGAPYEYFTYRRDGIAVDMVTTFADRDELAVALIYGEGQEATDPEAMTVDGLGISVFPVNARGRSAVRLEGICGEVDLWASWQQPNTDTLVQDVVWIAQAASCPPG